MRFLPRRGLFYYYANNLEVMVNVSAHPSSVRRRVVLVLAPYLVFSAAFLAVFGSLRSRLPDPVAIHFGTAGRADGFTSLAALPYEAVALLLIPGVVLAVCVGAFGGERAGAKPVPARPLIAIAYGVAGLVAAPFLALVVANARADAAEDVRLSLVTLAEALAAAAVSAGLGLLLAGKDAPAPPGNAEPGPLAPGLTLGRHESAAWTRTTGSRALAVTGAALLALGAVVGAAAGWGWSASFLIPGAMFLLCCRLRVTVDRHGLSAGLPWGGLPRIRIPLARVERASSRDVRALADFGGWGYRVHPGSSGLVLRSGEALVAHLTTGSEFAVTVDDSATAAALLNALIARDRENDPAGQGG